eukprot:514107-Lingulodinium_polyedra.AAC.1
MPEPSRPGLLATAGCRAIFQLDHRWGGPLEGRERAGQLENGPAVPRGERCLDLARDTRGPPPL